MLNMQVYLEYMVILILYSTVIVLNNILKIWVLLKKFRIVKIWTLNMSISTYSN
jgi:hypothetical protein